jgi:hypothetical protein
MKLFAVIDHSGEADASGLELSTEGQHPEAVAEHIRAACPDQLLTPAPPPH